MRSNDRSAASNNSSGMETNRLDKLRQFLQRYRFCQYFDIFVAEGFDRLLSWFDITESDLISLNVKQGHRLLLQRAIATARGVPISPPILINYGYDEPVISQTLKPGTISTQPATNTLYNNDDRRSQLRRGYDSNQRKRKQYIPSKPVTAFDQFRNELKVEFQGMVLSEISFIALERWNKLSGAEKENYEREDLQANSDYVMYRVDFDNDRTFNRRSTSRYEPRPLVQRQATPDLEYNSSVSSKRVIQNNLTCSD